MTDDPSSQAPSTSNRELWILAGLACAALCVLLPFLWDHTGADLKIYRLGGDTILSAPSALYSARLPTMSLLFTYPPFAGLVFVPFALLPWPFPYALSIACSVAALWVIVRSAVQPARLRTAAMVAAVAVCVLTDPVRETLSYGQINLFLCALVVYDVLDRKHPGRGSWVGVAAGIKLTPLVFVALLLVTRQWRALRYACATFAGTLLLGFAIAPSASWQYWTRLVFDSGRIGPVAFAGNQSWNGLFVRLGAPSSGAAWAVAVLVTVLGGLWLSRRLYDQGQELASLSVCAMVGLLCAPISWNHHWVWIIPMGIALTQLVSPERPLRRALVAAVWFGFFIVAPYRWVPRTNDREFAWTVGQQFVGNAYVIAALAAIVVLAVSTRRRPAASVSTRASRSGSPARTGP
ncbi:glycosyltransferase 87 family protein [Kribbella sp.]|uniref:glycosyltransferase 87 family protein n=1 Tax=Kribbella sp. TaxID=1871183 RepID=UPI002D62432C|nr:glycosyltransferase 87 family protein [Kribbella sp.]HZX02798.1 glycosyltransferase 87 family protein [Kribbella sp.]